MTDLELVDEPPLLWIDDFEGRPAGLEGHNSGSTFALDEELLVQAQGISIERHGRVEIIGFHYET